MNTISLIFLTAVIGLYFAKVQGIKTIRSGLLNFYQNKAPIYEIISGTSIAIAALFLIIPGFFTDTLGFIILIPFTRKIFVNFFINKNKMEPIRKENALDGEIIDDKKDEL